MEELIDILLKAVFKALTADVISPDSLKFASSATVDTLINEVWDYLGIVGMSFTLVYFLFEINMKLGMEGASNITMKTFAAPFFKLALAVALLANGGKIMNQVLGFNNNFIDAASSTFTTSEPEPAGAPDPSEPVPDPSTIDPDELTGDAKTLYDAFKEEFDKFGLVQQLVFVLIMILVWLVTLILGVVWYYKAIMYKLELVYRLCITPIAFADVYSGQHSNAIKWVKGTAALGLYAGAILLVPKMGNLIAVSSLGTISDLDLFGLIKETVTLLIMPFACLGVMSTIKQLCKEVVG